MNIIMLYYMMFKLFGYNLIKIRQLQTWNNYQDNIYNF